MEAAMKHICRKINAAHQTGAAVAHSLRYDSSATDRGNRSSPYVLYRIWQPCVLAFATENLRYLVTNAQIDAVERTLIHSLALQRTLHCFTSPHITMIELYSTQTQSQQNFTTSGAKFVAVMLIPNTPLKTELPRHIPHS